MARSPVRFAVSLSGVNGPELVLGPLLRHADEHSATVWVETSAACEVTVLGTSAPTFEVFGHHYALVVLTGLDAGSALPYTVELDGATVWPEPGSAFPPSRVRTLPLDSTDTTLRLVFGSCRNPSPDEAQGVDALVRYAHRMASLPERDWPQALLLLGDQVYADETSRATRRWLARRRDVTEPPGTEVVHFEEYAHLYHETWSEPALRWLLSTVPVSMIFDDHDVRDDWNTSAAWREKMSRTPWWGQRLRNAFVSYWVYQHLGNLGPSELKADETASAVLASPGDKSDVLRALADAAADDPDGVRRVRWSYRRQLGRVRLLMIDSRAGRVLSGGRRAMLDDAEFAWVEDAAETDAAEVDHLLLGTSVPWLLPPAISHAESVNEAACRRPGLRGRISEALRQAIDLEHWAAFRESFDRLGRLVTRVATRERPPASVLVLSGDVHHSYVSAAHVASPPAAPVYQLTCSPLHNQAPWPVRAAFSAAWWRVTERLLRARSRRAGVPPPDFMWSRVAGPCFDNAVMTVELTGRHAVSVLEHSGKDGLSEYARTPLTGDGGND